METVKSKTLLRLKDIVKVNYVSAVDVSKDFDTVVFVKYLADEEKGIYIPHIYKVSTEGGEACRIVEREGETEDLPAFSPDGKKLSYISNFSGERQICLINMANEGHPIQITTLRHGVTKYCWSPDGSKIAFETKIWPNETDSDIFREMTKDEKEQWEWEQENMPRATEELMYKFDETFGFVDGGYRQIGVLDINSKECRLLTREEHHADTPVWSNDGKSIAFFNYIYTHHKATRFEIFVISLENDEIKQITENTEYIGSSPAVFTKDDKEIIYSAIAEDDKNFILKLIKKSVDGKEVVNLFPKEEVCHGVYIPYDGRTVFGVVNSDFQRCGDYIYFMSSCKGYTHILRLNMDGEPEIEQITKGEASVYTFCAPVNNKLIYSKGDLDTLTEVYCLDLVTREDKRLTFSNEWLNGIINSRGEEICVPAKDGMTSIHGWVIPPANYEEGKKYPVVLYIHDGPTVCNTAGWWHESQLLAAAGNAVVYCDPRGSAGFGHDFASDESARGTDPIDDLMGFLDAALEKYPYMDRNRIGVTGESYGGYMTVKLLGRMNKRFKAAVVQRVFCNPAVSYGTGDMGFISSSPEKPKSFKDYIYGRTKGNTLTKIDNIKTPLLILHGMADYRCGMEQAEQLFIAMKERNPEIPVRMVLFPGENHVITRTGRITFKMRHVDEMVNWFSKYLSEKEAK